MAIGLPVRVDEMRLGDVAQVQEIERLSFSTPWPTYAFEQELRANRLARYVVARAAEPEGERVVGFAGAVADGRRGPHHDLRRASRLAAAGSRPAAAAAAGRTCGIELGALRMTLEVRVSNVAAQELYRGFGFTIAGTRVRYYTDDGEDAFVMTTPDLARRLCRTLIADERARRASR